MKTAKRIIISCVLVILATAFIFSNSLKNGEQSNKDSGVIEEVVEPIIIGVTNDPNADVNFIVRKGAMIGFLLVFAVVSIIMLYKKKRTSQKKDT